MGIRLILNFQIVNPFFFCISFLIFQININYFFFNSIFFFLGSIFIIDNYSLYNEIIFPLSFILSEPMYLFSPLYVSYVITNESPLSVLDNTSTTSFFNI